MKVSDYLKLILTESPEDPQHALRILLLEQLQDGAPYPRLWRPGQAQSLIDELLILASNGTELSPERFKSTLQTFPIGDPDSDLATLLFTFSLLYPEYVNEHTQRLNRPYWDQVEFDHRITTLMTQLTTDSPATQITAALALGQLAANLAPDTQHGLLRILYDLSNDGNLSVREAAISALGQLATHLDPNMQRDILMMLCNRLADNSFALREAAARALARLASAVDREMRHALLPILHARLTDDNLDIRATATRALGHLASALDRDTLSGLIPILSAQLTDNPPAIKVEATRALGQIASALDRDALSGLLPILRERLTDNFRMVRMEATSALGQIARISDQDALGDLLPILRERLTDNSGMVRIEATSALSQLAAVLDQDTQHHLLLEQLHYQFTNSGPATRAAATKALGQLALVDQNVQHDLLPKLRALLTDRELPLVRATATSTLGQLAAVLDQNTQRDLLPVLLTQLNDNPNYSEVQTATIIALNRFADSLTPVQRINLATRLLELLLNSDIIAAYHLEEAITDLLIKFAKESEAMNLYLLFCMGDDVPNNHIYPCYANLVKMLESIRYMRRSVAVVTEITGIPDIANICGAYLNFNPR